MRRHTRLAQKSRGQYKNKHKKGKQGGGLRQLLTRITSNKNKVAPDFLAFVKRRISVEQEEMTRNQFNTKLSWSQIP